MQKVTFLTRMLGAMYFTSHARTSHFDIFPRTHFARTCAFYLLSFRTRTRTSKVCIYLHTIIRGAPIWFMLWDVKKNCIFFFFSFNFGFSSSFQRNLGQSFFSNFHDWIKIFSFFHNQIKKIQVRSHIHKYPHARTFARTIPRGFAPLSHRSYRTRTCDRTFARTHTNILLWLKGWFTPPPAISSNSISLIEVTKEV